MIGSSILFHKYLDKKFLFISLKVHLFTVQISKFSIAIILTFISVSKTKVVFNQSGFMNRRYWDIYEFPSKKKQWRIKKVYIQTQARCL